MVCEKEREREREGGGGEERDDKRRIKRKNIKTRTNQ